MLTEAQDTPLSELVDSNEAIGTGLLTHRVPVQRSANVPAWKEPAKMFESDSTLNDPTAMHVLSDAHDTAVSPPLLPPGKGTR
jgi:hypothetical protein